MKAVVSRAFEGSRQPEIRLIHYLGSKLRLLSPIRDAVAEVVPRGGIVCDLFSGSGTVAAALSTEWNVLASDVQEYSRVITSALLRPPASRPRASAIIRRSTESETCARLHNALSPLVEYEGHCLDRAAQGDPDELFDLLEHGSLVHRAISAPRRLSRLLRDARKSLGGHGLDRGTRSVVTRFFGGTYFSWSQAIALDSLLETAHAAPEDVRDYLVAGILSAASDAVNSVGKQFAQPIRPRDMDGRPKPHLVRQTIRDREIDVLTSFEEALAKLGLVSARPASHRAVAGDYRQILSDKRLQLDGIYADPPYTRDHYSRFYHVLETMARRDEPRISTTTIRTGGKARLSRGAYRDDRHQSPFCIKSKVAGAFDDLFRLARERGVPVVLSYSPYRAKQGNNPRLLHVSEIVRIASGYFRKVDIRSVDVAHNKFNLADRNVEVGYAAEVLVTCRI